MNKNIKILFFFLLILIQRLNLQSQNLVPNPSFELISSCPSDLHDFAQFLYWLNPTSSSPSIFNTCNTTNAGVPNNGGGYQNAFSEIGYAGISSYYEILSYREYIEVELNSNLVANNRYNIRFYVNLADSSMYAVNNIGAYLSTNYIYQNTHYVLNYTPQIINNSANPLTSKTKWTLIEGNYIASGGEKYLTIGNFNDDSNSDTVFVGSGPWGAFYYIDDVYVGLDTTVDVSENTMLEKNITVYPNPAKDKIIITNNDKYLKEIEVTISNITGQKIISDKFQNQNQKEINISKLINDIYILKIQSGNKIEYIKLIKQ